MPSKALGARGSRVDLKRISSFGLALVVAFMAIGPAFAQEPPVPPLPRPRPDPSTLPAITPEGETQEPASGEQLPAGSAPSNTSATDAISAVTTIPQPVHLSAKVTEDGATIPEGVTWRVFDTRTDASGELALVAKSDAADARLELPPGEYVVHVAYGRAQASSTLSVVTGDNEKAIVLDAGALRLNAAVTGDIAIPTNLLHFDVFTSGPNEADRVPVAEDVNANDIMTLNAGTYHVVSYFGEVNAVVRADLRVEPGQLTEATLYHRASQITFKLVSETGGEAIADVEWTVRDSTGKVIYSDINAFPATVLGEGEYTVLAKRGENVFNRAFEVAPGQAREIEVRTDVYGEQPAAPAAEGAATTPG